MECQKLEEILLLNEYMGLGNVFAERKSEKVRKAWISLGKFLSKFLSKKYF